MTDSNAERRIDTADLLTAARIVVTPEGRARARRRLAEAEARRTPEQVAIWRRQLGLKPSSKA